MRILAGVLLALVALFAGGCSVFFAIADLGGSGLGAGFIWGPGLLLGGLCGWGAYKLFSGAPSKPSFSPANADDVALPPQDGTTPPGKRDNWG